MTRSLRTAIGAELGIVRARVGVTFLTVNRWEKGSGELSPLAWQRIIELQEKTDKSRQGMHRGANA